MTILTDYRHFGGYHWETGSVHNFCAYRGFKAPHTGQPYSEPFLMGVSGGCVMGYFTFAYEGYDPQCNILTRNTFDPLETMLSRLGVVQHLEHTALPQKAEAILADTLADGIPAIVWADAQSLPYNLLRWNEGALGASPLVVYGLDRERDAVYIADRADVPLTIAVVELAAARARVKKEKHRLLTLDAPDPAKLASAVRAGLNDCVNLFTGKPPKGTPNNWGLNAYRFWAEMLTQPKARLSWAKVFPPGPAMYAGLTSAYNFAFLYGKGHEADAERSGFATFLDEAAVLLQAPGLHEAANRFRASAEAWRMLPEALLPDRISPFGQARRLMWRRHRAFLEQGREALGDMKAIGEELASLRQSMVHDFPLTEAEAASLREQIAGQIMRIHDTEQWAVEALSAASA